MKLFSNAVDEMNMCKRMVNDVYDPEKGLAMAIAKKAYGNKGNYYNLFSEWLEPELKYYPEGIMT